MHLNECDVTLNYCIITITVNILNSISVIHILCFHEKGDLCA